MFSDRHYTWLKAVLLGFWMLWFLLNFSANLNSGLMQWTVVSAHLPFHTSEYGYLLSLMTVYHSTTAVFNVGYVLYICALGIASVLFIVAFIQYLMHGGVERTADWVAMAFTFVIAINLIILLFDIVYLAQSVQPMRMIIVLLQLMSFCVMRWRCCHGK